MAPFHRDLQTTLLDFESIEDKCLLISPVLGSTTFQLTITGP